MHRNDLCVCTRVQNINGFGDGIMNIRRCNWIVLIGLLTFFGSFSGLMAVPLSGNYSVGGASASFNTLSEALAALNTQGQSAEVTFNLNSGTYNGPFIINRPSSEHRFILRADEDTDAILDNPSATSTENYVLKIDNSSNITISQLHFTPSGSYRRAIEVMGNSDDLSFFRNSFSWPQGEGSYNSEGIYFLPNGSSDADNISFMQNNFVGGSWHIYINCYTSLANFNDWDFNINGHDGGYGAVYLKQVSDLRIYGGIVENTNSGFTLESCSGDLAIYENRILANQAGISINGSNFSSPSAARVYNNLITMTGINWYNPNSHSDAWGIYLSNCVDLSILHNSVLNNSQTSGSVALSINGSNLIAAKNNLSSLGQGVALYAYNDSNPVEFNNLYAAYTNLARIGNTYYHTYAELLEDFDYPNQNVYPFYNADLQTLSPKLDSYGPAYGVTTDFMGLPRSTESPSIGAYEYSADPALVPLSGTVSVGLGQDYPSLGTLFDDLSLRGISGNVNVNLSDSLYTEQLVLKGIPGAENYHITIQPVGRPLSIFRFSDQSTAQNYLMQLIRCTNITFQGIGFETLNPTYSNLIDLYGYNYGIRFLNCDFEATQSNYGTSIGNAYGQIADEIEILACDFTKNKHAVYLYGSYATIGSCYFTDQQYGTLLNQSTGSDISGNGFYGLTNTCIQVNGGKSLLITRNQGEGIATGINVGNLELDGTNRNLIANNAFKILDANMRYGIWLGGNGINLLNNTFQTLGTHSYALYCYQMGTDIDIVNNIFATIQTHAVELSYFTPSADKVIDYNCYFTPNNTLVRFGTYHSSLDDLQATYPQYNAHSIYVNPLLSNDLHTTSPWLRRVGTVRSEVTHDMDNEFRGEFYDIGADQQTGAYGFTPLSGTYDIGVDSAYPTFQAFMDDLVMYGSIGQVTARFNPGTHAGMNLIGIYPRVIPASQLVITAMTGVEFAFTPDNTGAQNNYLFKLQGTDNVKLSGLNVSIGTPGTQSSAIVLDGKCDDILIENSIFDLGTGYNNGIYAANSVSDGLSVIDCTFTGGQRALNISGSGYTDNLYENIRIEDCSFNNTNIPLEISKANNFKLLTSQLTNFTAALNLSYAYGNTDIVRNRFISHGYLGSYSSVSMLNFSNVSGTADEEIEILNNIIYSSGNQIQGLTGINLGNCSYLRVYHNSISLENRYAYDYSSAIYTSNSHHLTLVNNILSSFGSGFALRLGDNINNYFSHNAYYATGLNLVQIANIAYPVATALGTLADAAGVIAYPLPDAQGYATAAYLADKGAPSFITSDIDYDVFDATIPIGASEIAFAAALSGSYSVGSGGAFSSLGEALAAISSRGISAATALNLLPGNYSLNSIQYYIPNSLQYPVTISGSDATLISTASAESANYILKLTGVRNLHFENLFFNAPNPALSRCVTFEALNEGISFQNCSFSTPANTQNTYHAAAFYLDSDLLQGLSIDACSFSEFNYGLYLSGNYQNPELNTGLIVSSSSFSNCHSAAYVSSFYSPAFLGNTVTGYTYSGLYLPGNKGQMQISSNAIRGNGSPALLVSNHSGNGSLAVIANNYLHNYNPGFHPTAQLESCSFHLYHNSILRTNGNSSSTALYLGSGILSSEVVNNIFSTSQGYAASLGNLGNLSRYDHNLFHHPSAAPVYVNSTPIANLGQWTSLTGDTTCIFADPMLVTDSFELLAASPAINAGIAIDGYAYDILGRLRTMPDLGCREYDGSTLASPSGLQISYDGSSQEIVLTWNAVGGASGYIIYSADDPDATLWTSLNVSVNSARIPISAARKFYKVSAVN